MSLNTYVGNANSCIKEGADEWDRVWLSVDGVS